MQKFFPELKNNSWLFAGVLLTCFMLSALVRYQQFETWEKIPASFFVGERPMMTTLDAPYWLRWAREYNEGVYLQNNGLRAYPNSSLQSRSDGVKVPENYRDPSLNSSVDSTSYSPLNYFGEKIKFNSKTPEIIYRDVPLLSFLIAHVSHYFDYNYYLAGTLLGNSRPNKKRRI